MAKINRKEIWIHRDHTTNDISICSGWHGHDKLRSNFTKAEALQIYEAIKPIVEKLYPGAVINPWADVAYGTLD